VALNQQPHCGAAPDQFSGWISNSGAVVDLVASFNRYVARCFCLGQKVSSALDITEDGKRIVRAGVPGWVKGENSMRPECGLKVRFRNLDRDVNVLIDEVDNLDGPKVVVESPGCIPRVSMIVNSNQNQVKVYYLGLSREFDEWINVDSDRITGLPPFLEPRTSVSLHPQARRQHGALIPGEVGVIVGSEGPQHLAPYKVLGPRGEYEWYPACSLVEVDMD